jgi:hypothetical protein
LEGATQGPFVRFAGLEVGGRVGRGKASATHRTDFLFQAQHTLQYVDQVRMRQISDPLDERMPLAVNFAPSRACLPPDVESMQAGVPATMSRRSQS